MEEYKMNEMSILICKIQLVTTVERINLHHCSMVGGVAIGSSLLQIIFISY
jgi:hypothetical protein